MKKNSPSGSTARTIDGAIGHIDRRRKNQFIMDLPRCKMNSGVQILGKIEVSVKSQTKTHFRQTTYPAT